MQLKICIISTGASVHTRRWAQSLAQRGHRVWILSPVQNIEPLKGVEIVELGRNAFAPNRLRALYLHSLNAIEIRGIIRRIQPDIVHYHSLDHVHPLLIARLTCFGKNPGKMFVSTWGTDIIPDKGTLSKWDQFSKRSMLHKADKVSATSRMLAHHTSLLMKSRPVHVVSFGVDCKMFTPQEMNTPGNDRFRISFIKHYKAKYGPDYLIKAMPPVVSEHPKVELILIGRGDQEQELRNLSCALHMEDHVRFLGPISHSEIPAILSRTDVFAMPSVYENETLGVAALEAQAMGVPVIATRVGGIPEAVIDGLTGILVEPRNEDRLAAAIIKLIKDPELRNRMGMAGRQHVLDHFDWEKNVEEMEALYFDALNASP